jgi:primase-polymerase (primpol)-like protein
VLNKVPKKMRDAARWLVHRAKRPFYVDGTPRRGTLDSPGDIARLATFEEATACLERGGYDGLGFALGPDGTNNYWQGVDLDKIDENGLAELANSLPGYVEVSPSGLGCHAIGYGAWFAALGANGTGVEAYCERRYFTVTGQVVRGSL